MTGIMEGKVVIITGAASGIGRATAQIYAREGARVIIADVNEKGGEETLSMINKQGHQGLFVRTDMTVETDVKTLVDRAMNAHGRLDAAFNNAGIEGMQASSADMPTNEFDKIIAVNLKGTFLCTQAAARQMAKSGKGGTVVNISSVHEDLPFPGYADYCASKGAIRMLCRDLALELAPYKINVVNVAPGAVDTPINKGTMTDPEKKMALIREIPLGRVAQPREIAKLVAYLAGDDASYITGTTIFIDGGLMHQTKSL